MSETAGFQDESERLRVVARARDESEYDLFVAAWTAWHGTEPSPGRIEGDFGAYLREEAVPFYVRNFVRQWLDANPGLLRQRAEQRRAVLRAQILALVLIILAVVIALLVGWQE